MKLIKNANYKDDDKFMVEVTRKEAAILWSVLNVVPPFDITKGINNQFTRSNASVDHKKIEELLKVCQEIVNRNA